MTASINNEDTQLLTDIMLYLDFLYFYSFAHCDTWRSSTMEKTFNISGSYSCHFETYGQIIPVTQAFNKTEHTNLIKMGNIREFN